MIYQLDVMESSISFLETINNKLIIIDAENERMLSTDGTTAGTSVFYTDPNVYFYNGNKGVVINNNKMLFMAVTDDEGDELYITDGTSAGTFMLKDIQVGMSGSFPYLSPEYTFELNGEIFFQANDGIHGIELWKTDGTSAGTVLVKDIFPGVDGGYYPATGGSQPVKLGNNVLFVSQDNNNNLEPWITDGTTAGTFLLKDITPSALPFLPIGSLLPNNVFNGELYFVGTSNYSEGTELWKTDGTTAGTVLVKDINPTGNGFEYSSDLSIQILNNYFYFVADDGVNGKELWKSDGTSAGTEIVKDINVGSNGSEISTFRLYNNAILFRANDGVLGNELWITDGTSVGTVLVKDINTTGNSLAHFDLLLGNFFDNLYFFGATQNGTERQLFYTDGTASGTQMIHPGGSTASTDLDYFDAIMFKNGAMYFMAGYDNGISMSEMWKISSTTSSVKEENNSSFHMFPCNLPLTSYVQN